MTESYPGPGPAGEITKDAPQPAPAEEIGEFTPFDGQDLASQPIAPDSETGEPAPE